MDELGKEDIEAVDTGNVLHTPHLNYIKILTGERCDDWLIDRVNFTLWVIK